MNTQKPNNTSVKNNGGQTQTGNGSNQQKSGGSVKTGDTSLLLPAVLAGGSIGHLNGFHMSEVESMVYIANASKLRVGDLLYAGVLISGLGAVMYVSVSMAAAMEEVHAKAPELSPWELFRSGMTVGHDMIGTMSNTLILAYTGSATGALLTIYSYEMPFLQVTGYNSIMIELLYGLCGTIGVILTVPIQAGITAFALRKNN